MAELERLRVADGRANRLQDARAAWPLHLGEMRVVYVAREKGDRPRTCAPSLLRHLPDHPRYRLELMLERSEKAQRP